MREGPTLPWSVSDARTAFLPVVFALVVLGWAWWDASGTGSLDDQTSALVFSVLGAGIAAAGCTSWVVAGRRAVRERRLAVVERLEQSDLLAAADTTDTTALRRFVAVPGTARYHRPDCMLVRGKDVERLGRTTGDRRACEMCAP